MQQSATPHFCMLNWLRACVMLLILFLKVEIEQTFEFPKIMFHTVKKKSKDNIAFSKSTLKAFLKYLTQNCYFMVKNSLPI